MIYRAVQFLRASQSYWALPGDAKVAHRADAAGLPSQDPGLGLAIDRAVEWLCRAQDSSTSKDGGVARHFSLISGWGPSYPETTGYIAPTLLDCARRRGDA